MAHRTVKKGFDQLVTRLNKAPQGAPSSILLNRILAILMSEKETGLLALLPIKPFTAETASRAWKLSLAESKNILNELASRALLVDVQKRGQSVYSLPPPMAGFFEFSLMRTRGDVDQAALSQLFYEYLNVEEDFVKELFTVGETQLGRIFIQEAVLSSENAAHVLDFERASEVVRTASHFGVGMCYCRHKKQHLGKACDSPMDICMTFNGWVVPKRMSLVQFVAIDLIKHGRFVCFRLKIAEYFCKKAPSDILVGTTLVFPKWNSSPEKYDYSH
ncbi:MAG: hypothetical protein GY780_15985 [bacterium]|nr:hypothetical protein [bacterium]